jgi:hypothetical protein
MKKNQCLIAVHTSKLTIHIVDPPPELVKQWCHDSDKWTDFENILSIRAARWGADQRGAATEAELQEARDKELEACVQWITEQTCFHPNSDLIKDLRAARRPKPPTLKEQAFAALRQVGNCEEIDNVTFETIRRALEALPND